MFPKRHIPDSFYSRCEACRQSWFQEQTIQAIALDLMVTCYTKLCSLHLFNSLMPIQPAIQFICCLPRRLTNTLPSDSPRDAAKSFKSWCQYMVSGCSAEDSKPQMFLMFHSIFRKAVLFCVCFFLPSLCNSSPSIIQY